MELLDRKQIYITLWNLMVFTVNISVWIFSCIAMLLLFIPIWAFSRIWVRLFYGWIPLKHSEVGLFLSDQPTSRSHLTWMSLFGAEFTDDHLQCVVKRFESFLRLPESLTLRAVPNRVLGFLYWKPVEIDVKLHVRIADGLDPQLTYSKGQLEKMMSKYSAVGFHLERPLWEFLFVPKVNFNDNLPPKFCVIFRLHHCIGDGLFGMNVIQKHIIDEAMNFYPIPQPDRLPWWNAALNNLIAIYSVPTYVFVKIFRRWKIGTNFRPLTGNKFYHISREISVDLIRFIKAKAGTNFSDVLLSSAVAVFHYNFKRKSYQHDIILTAFPTAFKYFAKDDVNNNFAFVTYPFPNRPMDPLCRLKSTAEITSELACSTCMLQFYWTSFIAGKFVPVYILKLLINNLDAVVVMSYMPGSRNIWKINGAPSVVQGNMMPHVDRTALGISMQTYLDKVRIGIIADGSAVSGMSEVQNLAEKYVRNIEEMGRILGYKENSADL